MYKIFLSVITVILIISSLCISFFKPKMHRNILIFDSNFEVVQPKDEGDNTKNIPTKTQIDKEKKEIKKTKPVKTQTKVTYNPKTTKEKTDKATTKTQQKTENISTQKTMSTNKKIEVTNPTVEKTVTKEENKAPEILTEQEETILWNKWRSDLQNQIMQDVKLPIIPNGIIFKFKFDVDKFGKVSNIQTWSVTPSYTPYAIQYIAPVIKSYQGHSILNFPTGSKRISTTVEGAWKISQTSKYSTPQDYQDTETINK